MTHNGGLTGNEKKALAALLATTSIRAAADQAGLTRRTVDRYLADPVFRSALTKQQDNVIAATVACLIGGTSKALLALMNALDGPKVSDALKVRAAQVWLGAQFKQVELMALVARVERLEEKAGGAK